MKKNYETPIVEKVAFMYRDQVVAASSGGACTQHYEGNRDLQCNPTHWTGDNASN